MAPKLATAEVMPAVAVTEPDYGSDVAGITVTATPADGPAGEPGWVINGVKTWCTFGARADVLICSPAPTRSVRDPPRPVAVHRAQAARRRPRVRAHPGAAPAGKMEGRPIDTIGYRGMHRYEIALDNWWVPAENLIGERRRPRQGLLLPDGGLRERPAADGGPGPRRDAGGLRGRRSTTPGTATVFGSDIIDYQLTRAKLGRMAVLIQAGRQFAYARRHADGEGEGATEA